ncbi:LOW QUALITY PROTEIN: protein shortage in chiasmata 1 ortholog [Xenentodon cancila]
MCGCQRQRGSFQSPKVTKPHINTGTPNENTDINVKMCEASSAAAKAFSVVTFKALDYVLENSTRLRVATNLLALPTPYLPETSDLNPHSSNLSDSTYRTPWVTEKLLFNAKSDVEVIPSSNPDPLKHCDQDQNDCLLNELQINNPYLFLPVELIPTDHLSQMKRRLPSLKDKLSRLGILPVADPLLGSTGRVISEDAMFSCFRHCSPYEKPPDVDTTNIQTCAFGHEEFVKESLMEGENFGVSKDSRRDRRTSLESREVSSICEPQADESRADFQPLREALRVVKLETEGFTGGGNKLVLQVGTGTPQVFLGSSLEFTESLAYEFPTTGVEEMEVFRKLLPERVDEKGFSAQTNDVKTGTGDCKTEQSSRGFELVLSSRQNVRDNDKSQMLKRRQPEKDVDPLSSFMMLRSQQALQVAVTPQSSDTTAAEEKQVNTQIELPTPPEQKKTPASMSMARDASRVQKRAAQWSSLLIRRPDSQPNCQERPGCRVIQVQATDSQQRAYRELLAFAQPCLSSARKLGLSFLSWGDFSCLAPDQTHFLLKQQERALCRTPAHNVEVLRDLELLFSQAALIHVLVTVKELLLKCDLGTAVVYLTEASEASAEQSLQKLLKKLKVILYLSKKNQESNFKLLELQRFLSEWLHSSNRQTAKKVSVYQQDIQYTSRILVILSVDCDESRSVIISSLSQVVGAATSVCPEEGKKKLNGASVVSSMCNADCLVVYEQHIGPDFPWSCFSVVVEFDHPGQAPWSTICSERSISHFTFNTIISDADTEQTLWCLEDSVPFIVFVTEGLLNRPLLLQTLESSFNVTVLERNHCPTLQMLGGIQNYEVITVDESTAIVFQVEDELGQERASEGLVMRLTALSLQYSCCWLILHCPDSQGGGFSSEAFSNLVLIYSSLVLFSMKSEDLDVKVLIVSEVLQTAKLIKQICFTTMMSSDRDPLKYLNRDWLVVIPSQEEKCLSQFACINPLVGQLMLSRAPSLQWLLRAPLTQLKDRLPDVPHKVLKRRVQIPETVRQLSLTRITRSARQKALLTHAGELMNSLDPDLFSSKHNTSFLFGPANAEDSISKQDSESAVFTLDPSCSFGGPGVHLQRSWTSSDLWREGHMSPFWRSRAGAAGRVVERVEDVWSPTAPPDDYSSYRPAAVSPLNLESAFSYSPTLQQAVCQFPRNPVACSDSQPSHRHHLTWSLSPLTDFSSGPDQTGKDFLSRDGGMIAVSANYGSRCWKGQERKRGEEAPGLVDSESTPVKRARWSYDRVPGRSDGQTRLRLF